MNKQKYTKKVLIWGYHNDDSINAIEELKQEGIISIAWWFGNHKRFNNNLAKLVHNPYTVLERNYKKSLPPSFDDKIRIYFEPFVEGYSRINFYKGQSVHELWHLFYLYANYFYDLIATTETQLILFQNLPHHGVDMILYGMAKTMGVRTILTAQPLIPNRFWYLEDIEDFGRLENIPIKEKFSLHIEKKFQKEIFYMKDIKKPKSCCFCTLLNDLRRLLMGRKHKPMRFSGMIYKYRECKTYKRLSEHSYADSVDLEKKFVYFPLQLQPEMTTSTLGKKYVDQLLALEHLSALLPDDWLIYAKENPKQTAMQRNDFFYHRLNKIKKVRYLPLKYNTYQLIEKSRFVSVVTGTAGWEAISGGKNVLVFGYAWYRCLPGVFNYHPNISLQEILSYEFSHQQLEKSYSELMGKTFPGIMDPAYFTIHPEYSSQQNKENIISFLKTVITDKL